MDKLDKLKCNKLYSVHNVYTCLMSVENGQCFIQYITCTLAVTGNETVGFAEDDFVTDFDPDHYDKRMSTVFGKEYYENDETEKPIFPSDEGMQSIAGFV